MSTPTAWPSLPTTHESATRLIAERTLRPVTEGIAEEDLAPEALLRALASPGSVIAGEERVRAHLQAFLDRAGDRDAYLLFGALHDSAGQLDTFRRLVGPLGLRGLSIVAVEPFRADGRWAGVPVEAQQGDGSQIDAWFRGDRTALDVLVAQHSKNDYAAWKFRYEGAVLELLVSARAAQVPFAGCDMPLEAQRLLVGVTDDDKLRLRELHCVLSLDMPRPHRAALFWGQSHVRRGGLRRFLPKAADVLALDVLGHREGEWTAEHALAKVIAVVDPVLIPLGEADMALLLPGGAVAAVVDRVRDEARIEGLSVAVTEGEGTLHIGAREIRVSAEPTRVTVPPGDTAYVFEAGGLRFVGAIDLPTGGGVDLVFDPSARTVRLTEHRP